ncbi:hypothetical protein GSS87_01220 [Corynebacterium sp. 4HC-13]|uniref:hypothetical protein n=1 Tax=Corynebacterium anserum TaxID=2684406 RepID=UPI001639CF6A|nr:hypothetical protein [Corynebacterium anserum]MBC2681052.1 hypothetical protein [Corynebacterium anserum]
MTHIQALTGVISGGGFPVSNQLAYLRAEPLHDAMSSTIGYARASTDRGTSRTFRSPVSPTR